MPYDVTMCDGGECPRKEDCLRFTGERYARQDFFGSPPYNKQTGECELFMTNRPNPEWVRDLAYKYYLEENCPPNKELEHWLRAEQTLIARMR